MAEKDFNRAVFKINVAGSWASLVYCHADQYDQVKAACETLASAHRGSIRFKALDAAGDVIEEYSPVHGISQWHDPRTR